MHCAGQPEKRNGELPVEEEERANERLLLELSHANSRQNSGCVALWRLMNFRTLNSTASSDPRRSRSGHLEQHGVEPGGGTAQCSVRKGSQALEDGCLISMNGGSGPVRTFVLRIDCLIRRTAPPRAAGLESRHGLLPRSKRKLCCAAQALTSRGTLTSC